MGGRRFTGYLLALGSRPAAQRLRGDPNGAAHGRQDLTSLRDVGAFWKRISAPYAMGRQVVKVR